jgi:hypothetical protein
VLEKFIRVFSKKLRREAAKVSKLKIKVDRKVWEVRRNQFGPRSLGVKRDAELERQVRQLLEARCVKESIASFYSFAFLVPKPNGTWRMVLNFKGLNKATTNVDRWPIPYIEHLLRKIGQLRPKYFAVMDLTKGFYQCEIDEESSPFTAFITSSGVYEWLRVPMGITAAPSHFQRIIANEVLHGLVGLICMVYIDDVIVLGDSEESYLKNLANSLQQLRVTCVASLLGQNAIRVMRLHRTNVYSVAFLLNASVVYAEYRLDNLRNIFSLINMFRTSMSVT